MLGAIDGKHIRIQRPPGSGSFFYNYKHYYSIVLMGLVDANYEFLFVDVGAEGKASDGGIWRKTGLFQLMNEQDNILNVPGEQLIKGIRDPLPYFVVADDAFAMSPHVMKPYGSQGLSDKHRIFNYRLSRSRMVVENAFGILSTKFRVFRREIEMHPEGTEKLVLATVVLHNMLRRKCGAKYMPQCMIDHEDEGHRRVLGIWRNEPALDALAPTQSRNHPVYASAVRERLTNFFLQKEGEVSWQYKCALE